MTRSLTFAMLPCGSRFPARLFLFVLLVANELKQRATSGVFAHCPRRCRCNRSTTNIRCVNLNLTSVPRHLPAAVTTLVFSANRIHILNNGSLSRLTAMMSLTLSANRIKRIERGSFFYLVNIRVLRLDHNQIRNIHSDTFATNILLTELNLSDNELTSVDAHIFRHLTRMRTLKLARNRITSFADDTFAGLNLLRSLDVAGNGVSSLEAGVFVPLLSLTFLNVSQMALQSLDVSAFASPSTLQSMDASGNAITTIGARHFDRFQSLRHLNLSSNPIMCDTGAIALRLWLEDTHFGVVASGARNSTVCAMPEVRVGFLLFQLSVAELALTPRNDSAATVILTKVIQLNRYANGYTLSEYDPKTGWYTAATLLAMLLAFLLFVALDKLKRTFWQRFKRMINVSRHASADRKGSERGASSYFQRYDTRGATVQFIRERGSRLMVDRKTDVLNKHVPLAYEKCLDHRENYRQLVGERAVLRECGTPLGVANRAGSAGRVARRTRSQEESSRVSMIPSTKAVLGVGTDNTELCLQTITRCRNENLTYRSSTPPSRTPTCHSETKLPPAPAAAITSNAQARLCVVSNDAPRWRNQVSLPTPSFKFDLADTPVSTDHAKRPTLAIQLSM